ncbi:MAG: tetratricopeptide repeat protein [Armatimonadetes bacterium]|nr:tetratricopeptide repeat protein [Armatimonadota bacterium]
MAKQAKRVSPKKISFRDQRKKRQKIVFIVLTIFLSLGLLSSSVVWLGGDYFSPPPPNEPAEGNTVADLEARVKEKPDDAQALAALARAYFDAGRLEEAQQTYEKALAQNPDDGALRLELAMTSFLRGDYDKAIAALEEEIKRRPDHAEAHYLYGQVLAAGKKDYARGIQELEKFVALAKTGDDVARARQMIAEWQKNLPAKESVK